jgi:signal peptidase II
LLACVAGLVGCDHATKLAAESALRDRPAVPIVPGIVDLRYAENSGVAFSALERLSVQPPAWLLVLVALAAVAAILAWWLRRPPANASALAGMVLILAGALGNAIDRALRGHVIDFIAVRFWPVFNVADALVVAGVALLFLGRRLGPTRAGPTRGGYSSPP